MNNNSKKIDQNPKRFTEPNLITQTDLIYFKNQTLKDLKEIEANILSKVKAKTDQYDTKFTQMETKINIYSTKITELSQSINSEKNNVEKIDKLYEFKSSSEYKTSKLETRLKEISENFSEEIHSMKKIINESINYPGVIGPKSKFNDFRAFIDYLIKSISSINVFKDKMSAFDIQSYKTNLDKIIKSYKTEFDRYMSSSKNLVSDTFVVFDNKVAALFKTFEDKLENEKNLLQKNIDEMNININSLKNELIYKIGIHDDENEKKFLNLNSKYDKYYSDIDLIHKKLEETDDNIKKIFNDYDDKIKEQENKFSSKLNNLLSALNYTNNSSTNFLNNYKSIETSNPLRDFGSVKSKIKNYIEGDISLNNTLSNRDIRIIKRQNTPAINSNNGSDINDKSIKRFDKESIPYINNIKLINFYNEAVKNNKDIIDNKLFMNRKKIDTYILEKENLLINSVPKKKLIKNLLRGSEQLSFYIKKNKEDKKSMLNKIINKQKTTIPSKKNLDINDYLKERINNKTSQYFKKEKLTHKNNNSNSNQELEEFIRTNKRIFSSMSSKTRNNEQSSIKHSSRLSYNTTDKIKDKNSSIENEPDKYNQIKSNKAFSQENKKMVEYKKMKMKLINNFNSAFKQYDLNMKSEGLSNSKYKLNPIYKNKKILKKNGSPINQSFNSRYDKDKARRTSIHFYFNVKNKKSK